MKVRAENKNKKIVKTWKDIGKTRRMKLGKAFKKICKINKDITKYFKNAEEFELFNEVFKKKNKEEKIKKIKVLNYNIYYCLITCQKWIFERKGCIP